jgi:hypothetical protein
MPRTYLLYAKKIYDTEIVAGKTWKEYSVYENPKTIECELCAQLGRYKLS